MLSIFPIRHAPYYHAWRKWNAGYTILHGAHKQELLKDIIWKYKSTYVEPYEFKLDNGQILMAEDLIIAHCWIPDIQSIELSKRDNILELLRNSLIVSISTYNCLTIDSVDKINESYDENTLIYSIIISLGFIPKTHFLYHTAKQ